jgi:acyl-CoA synthetase (AMP-forming)/AMP-acid ligase II
MKKRIPQHVGPNILPNFSLFHRLLHLALDHRHVAIKDVAAGIEATHAQFLSDILHLRNTLRSMLSAEVRQQIERHQEIYICLLSRGSYEYAVGLLAIVALGAIAVPICRFDIFSFNSMLSHRKSCRCADSRGDLLREGVSVIRNLSRRRLRTERS